MPGRELQLETPDGRLLDVIDCGPAGAPTVLVQHGTPGSRLLLPEWLEDAESRGIRLVGYSRPGYGSSSRRAGRQVVQAATDVALIAERLKVTRLATWGYSGGAPHVLACAARLPQLVVAAAAVSTVVPYGAEGIDFLEGMGQGNVEEFHAALAGQATLRPLLEASSNEVPRTVAGFLEAMDSILSAPDREVMRSQLGDLLVASFDEALSRGLDGWIDDDLAFVRPWGFELAEIGVPLQLWQGGQDRMVPPAHGRWLARQLPAAESHQLPEAGHLSPLLEQAPAIHDWLLAHF
ncbi:MAG: alpha/beta fold hydrolase [Candidatus Dormibacteria bacterium]